MRLRRPISIAFRHRVRLRAKLYRFADTIRRPGARMRRAKGFRIGLLASILVA